MKRFPLMRNNLLREDLDAVIAHLQQDDPILTHGPNVAAFEAEWSAWLGVEVLGPGQFRRFCQSAVDGDPAVAASGGRRGDRAAAHLGFRYRIGAAERLHASICRYQSNDAGARYTADNRCNHSSHARGVHHLCTGIRCAGRRVAGYPGAAQHSADRGRLRITWRHPWWPAARQHRLAVEFLFLLRPSHDARSKVG